MNKSFFFVSTNKWKDWFALWSETVWIVDSWSCSIEWTIRINLTSTSEYFVAPNYRIHSLKPFEMFPKIGSNCIWLSEIGSDYNKLWYQNVRCNHLNSIVFHLFRWIRFLEGFTKLHKHFPSSFWKKKFSKNFFV